MEFLNNTIVPLAYIGPGAGMGLLVSLFGLLAAIGAAILGSDPSAGPDILPDSPNVQFQIEDCLNLDSDLKKAALMAPLLAYNSGLLL